MELGRLIYSRIKRYCAAGDKLADTGRFDDAIKKYNKAKDLLPDSVYNWEAATWIFTALGDAFYLSGRYEDAFHNLIEAQKCPDGIGNPFILLRIGQCYYELNDMGNARKYLLQAYMMEGDQIFQSEEEKYFKVIQGGCLKMVIENMCGEPLDLPFESLNNIDLIGYNFHRHFLKEISICNTNIIKCDFRNAKMVQVYMENTTIKDSILVMLDICDCSFVNCDFTGEYIAFCKFENVDFTGADFNKVIMKGNKFYNCNFGGANMNCSGMVDCKFVDSIDR